MTPMRGNIYAGAGAAGSIANLQHRINIRSRIVRDLESLSVYPAAPRELLDPLAQTRHGLTARQFMKSLVASTSTSQAEAFNTSKHAN